MNLDTLLQLIQTGDMTRTMSLLEHQFVIPGDAKKAADQFITANHAVNNTALRKDKTINVPTGQKDVNQNDILQPATVPVARLTLPIQEDIVMKACAFLGVPTMDMNPENDIETAMGQVLQHVHDVNKLDYKMKKICRYAMSECEVAELWYLKPVAVEGEAYPEGIPIDSNLQFSMRILSPSQGDTLFPVFDEFDDLVAFGRYYKVPTVNAELRLIQDVEHFDVYTATEFFYSKRIGSGSWQFGAVMQQPIVIEGLETGNTQDVFGYSETPAGIKNPIGKIPIVYYPYGKVAWSNVQSLIDRLEKKISNHADTNDYFDSPIAVATGTVEGFAEKGEQGKMVQLTGGSQGEKPDMKYLTWDQAPESMKMEMDNLMMFIARFTHTPDISFEKMQAIGRNLSGFAIRFLFMDPILKAKENEDIFGEGVQRRINYLKAAIAKIDPTLAAGTSLKVKPTFTVNLPNDEAADIANINTALAGGFLSAESAIEDSPLTKDPEIEKARIADEKAQAQADALAMAQATKPAAGSSAAPLEGTPAAS